MRPTMQEGFALTKRLRLRQSGSDSRGSRSDRRRELFGSLEKDVKLKHIDTRKYGAGMVQSEYEVVR
jgi:hypothetical protein